MIRINKPSNYYLKSTLKKTTPLNNILRNIIFRLRKAIDIFTKNITYNYYKNKKKP